MEAADRRRTGGREPQSRAEDCARAYPVPRARGERARRGADLHARTLLPAFPDQTRVRTRETQPQTNSPVGRVTHLRKHLDGSSRAGLER